MNFFFILVLTAFTVCLSRDLHRHRHEKRFPQGKMALQRDAYIRPKQGVEHNRLFPEYGTNFRYIGEVKHGLDRVTVVTSIPIPKYSNIRKKPLEFNCTIDLNRKKLRQSVPISIEFINIVLKSCHILVICRTKKSLWCMVSDNSLSMIYIQPCLS